MFNLFGNSVRSYTDKPIGSLTTSTIQAKIRRFERRLLRRVVSGAGQGIHVIIIIV